MMLSINDALVLISSISNSIWTLLTLSLTVNVAVLGWMIQRHGLYETKEKVIASIGYTGFVIVIILGMHFAYDKLDMAANDLAYVYKSSYEGSNSLITSKGLVAKYISMSPDYCSELRDPLSIKKCCSYYNKVYINISFILLGWLFNMVLFWYDGFWLKGRKQEK